MTKADWPECIKFTLQFEGGFDANPKDRGNWTSGVIGRGELKGTKYGIAAFVYPRIDIKNLTKDEAIAIYRRDYWPKVAGDEQPPGVDLIAWDICVNSGSSRALKIEAQAMGSNLTTASALANRAWQSADRVALVKKMCALRASFYRSLSTFSTFGKGWLRRNASAEALGVTMAMRSLNLSNEEIKKTLTKESNKASKFASTNATATAGTGTGSVVHGTTAHWNWDWVTVAEVGGLIVIVVAAVYFGRKYIQHRERAQAYSDMAKGIIGR